jgi:hypothetical protein
VPLECKCRVLPLFWPVQQHILNVTEIQPRSFNIFTAMFISAVVAAPVLTYFQQLFHICCVRNHVLNLYDEDLIPHLQEQASQYLAL